MFTPLGWGSSRPCGSPYDQARRAPRVEAQDRNRPFVPSPQTGVRSTCDVNRRARVGRARAGRRAAAARRPSSRAGWPITCTRTIPELAATEDDELCPTCVASARGATSARCCGCSSAAPASTSWSCRRRRRSSCAANVRRGIPLPALLRSYRLGHAWLWDRWSRALQERVADPDELLAAQESELGVHLRLHRPDQRRAGRGVRDRARADDARRRPAARRDGAGDPRAASRSTRRRCPGASATSPPHHVAMRVSSGTSEVRASSAPPARRRPRSAPGEPLVVPSGAASLDVWCGLLRAASTPSARALRAARGRPRRVRQAGARARRVPPLARRGGPGGARRLTRRRGGGAVIELRAGRAGVAARVRPPPRARVRRAAGSGRWRRPASRPQRLRETLLAFLARRRAARTRARRSSTSIRTRSPTGSSARRSCSAAASPRPRRAHLRADARRHARSGRARAALTAATPALCRVAERPAAAGRLPGLPPRERKVLCSLARGSERSPVASPREPQCEQRNADQPHGPRDGATEAAANAGALVLSAQLLVDLHHFPSGSVV